MKWNEKCILELTHHNLFESTEHRSRFVDLLSCYWESPFFSKGLCKCMYLAAWTDDTFNEFLDMLNSVVIEGAKSLRMMKENADVMYNTYKGTGAEMYRISSAFLSDAPYQVPDFSLMDPDGAYIIRRALLASRYIDDLPNPHDPLLST